MCAWIGIALLSVSWLLGLDYYHAHQWLAYAAVVLAGTLLLLGRARAMPSWIESLVGLALLAPAILAACLPAVLFLPWPYATIPALLGAGLTLSLLASAARAASPRLAKRGADRQPAESPAGAVLARCTAISQRSLASAAAACLLAGGVLAAQAVAMSAYAGWTSRSHELPAPLPRVVAAVAEAIGIRTGVGDGTVTAFSMRVNHRFGPTWELLLDPVTWCFLVGAAVLIAWRAGSERPDGRRFRPWLWAMAKLLGLVVLWLPLRAALLMALYLDDVLRTDYDALIQAMLVVWDPWVLLALLAVPVLLAWKFAGICDCGAGDSPAGRRIGDSPAKDETVETRTRQGDKRDAYPAAYWRRPLGVLLALCAGTLFALGLFWDPVGSPKKGRVAFEEFHPAGDEGWEPTNKPYNTEKYGELADYTYYCAYRYLGHYYDVSRLEKRIDDEALADLDVLIVKTPTRPYAIDEIEALRKFVENGGGLLLIGEHTDVYGTSTHLNAVAKEFGFQFRPDCLFTIDPPPEHDLDLQFTREKQQEDEKERTDDGKRRRGDRTTSEDHGPADENFIYDEHYARPPVPHPVVQHVPEMEFAVSCSIDPGFSGGRAVILGTGLKSFSADYHALNYYPQVEDLTQTATKRSPLNPAEMRYGAFTQLWTTRYGKGRVVGFTDSTDFSDFCVFEPGKAELMLGMVHWLNYRDKSGDPRLWLWANGLALLAAGLWASSRWQWGWTLLVSAGLLGWTSGAWATRQWNTIPPPQVKQDSPMVRVMMDRHVAASKYKHPKNGFTHGQDDQFGLFERWSQRLGYVPSRPRRWEDDFSGDLLVVGYPAKTPPDGFAKRLEQYVRDGGKLLVLDAPQNKQSKSNELLAPFGLSLEASLPNGGVVQPCGKWQEKVRAGKPGDKRAGPGVPAVAAVSKTPDPTGADARASRTAPTSAACTVSGGVPLALLDGKPVAATVAFGNGSVTVIGFGSRFSDANMGVTGDVAPNDELKAVYELEYSLLELITGVDRQ